jgi:exopolyphosphatase
MLNKFLSSATKLSLENTPNLFVVLGNEAMDLDSIVSSITYSHFLQCKNSKNVYVPIMNIPRQDLRLRTEVTWFLQKLEIDSNNLLFWPDIKNLKEYSLILVDHNHLASYQDHLGSKIVEIVDHHHDDKLYECAHRNIEMVGSTCTLIAREILKSQIPTMEIAHLLLGCILLDTQNLDTNFKATPLDIDVALQLRSICGMTELDQTSLYSDLLRERFSVESLTSYDLLRSDYKQFTSRNLVYGISSVKLDWNQWMEKDLNIVKTFDEFTREKSIKLLVVMCAYIVDGKLRRKLILYCKEDILDLLTYLEKSNLEIVKISSEKDVHVYDQHSIQSSRKQLQPLLADFLK